MKAIVIVPGEGKSGGSLELRDALAAQNYLGSNAQVGKIVLTA